MRESPRILQKQRHVDRGAAERRATGSPEPARRVPGPRRVRVAGDFDDAELDEFPPKPARFGLNRRRVVLRRLAVARGAFRAVDPESMVGPGIGLVVKAAEVPHIRSSADTSGNSRDAAGTRRPASTFGVQNQIARFLELCRVNRIETVRPVFQRRADQVARGINQDKTPVLPFGIEEQPPGRLERAALWSARINAHGAPLVGSRVLIVAVVGRAGEFLVEVFQVRDVFVAQRREQFQLYHRRHQVIRRHDHIIERDAAALDFGEHAFRVLVNVDRELAIELALKLFHDGRVNVFAPDEEIELEGIAPNQAGEPEA